MVETPIAKPMYSSTDKRKQSQEEGKDNDNFDAQINVIAEVKH